MELKPDFDFDKCGITANEIMQETEKLLKQTSEAAESKGLFLVRTSNRRIEQAKARTIPQRFFYQWFLVLSGCVKLSIIAVSKPPLLPSWPLGITSELLLGLTGELPGAIVLETESVWLSVCD